jgi:hypothetical protein
MRDTTRAFLVEVLIPSYEQFLGYYYGREVGFRKDSSNAAAVSEAMLNYPDHAFHEYGEAIKTRGAHRASDYRSMLWRQSRSYEIVSDFANAWKHRSLSRKGATVRSLDSAQENVAIVRYRDDEGFYYATRKYIVVKLSDGTEVELGDRIRESMTFITGEMLELGVVPVLPTIPKKKANFVSRQEAISEPIMRCRVRQAEKYSFQFRAMIFREAEGTITYGPPDGLFDGAVPIEVSVEAKWT